MNHRGFTLIELLVATAVLVTIVGAIVSLAVPMRQAFDRSVSAGDLAVRGRAGIETLLESVRQGGAGAIIGSGAFALPLVASGVIPQTSLDDTGARPPYEAVTVVRVPDGAGQALLGAPAAAGTWAVRLDPSGPCFRQTGECGFVDGVAAIVYDDVQAERVGVAGVNGGTSTLMLTSALQRSFGAGAIVAEIRADTFGLRTDPGGGRRLVRITEAGAEQTLVDHVVAFEVVPDDPDPLRIRRLDIRLRLETVPRLAPDLELRASVAPGR